MKDLKKAAAAVLAVIMLAGCSGSTDNGTDKGNAKGSSQSAEKGTKNKSAGNDKNDDAPVTVTNENAGDGIALIAIETNEKSDDILDFITKPVAPHISEQIASWTPGYVMPPEPYYVECTVTVSDDSGNTLIDGAGANVKVRGNWTTTYDKKPLRIKFDEKQSVLGMNDGAEMKNWVLLAEYKDASMLRDKAALKMSREILGADDLYAADAQLAEVTVNGNYWGVYLVSEQQQVNSDRVDITSPKDGYEGTDIGYFMEYDGYFYDEDELHQFSIDYADNAPLVPYDGEGGSGKTMQCLGSGGRDPKAEVGMTIKSDINSQAQHDFIANYTNNVYKIMYYAAYNDEAWVFDDKFENISKTDSITPEEAVKKVVNVDSLADMYLICEMACDADIYWSSFYMDVDFGEGGDKRLTFEAPWDFDSGLGNKDRCADGTGFYAANIVPDVNGGPSGGGMYETINPWLAVLMYEDWYQDIIREKWTAAYDAGVFSDTISMVENDKTELHDAFLRNYDRWDNISNNMAFVNELSPGAAACKTHEMAADYLIDWLNARVEFVNSAWHK